MLSTPAFSCSVQIITARCVIYNHNSSVSGCNKPHTHNASLTLRCKLSDHTIRSQTCGCLPTILRGEDGGEQFDLNEICLQKLPSCRPTLVYLLELNVNTWSSADSSYRKMDGSEGVSVITYARTQGLLIRQDYKLCLFPWIRMKVLDFFIFLNSSHLYWHLLFIQDVCKVFCFT